MEILMNKESIVQFLTALGALNIRETDQFVNCSCPLAPSRHKHGTDRHPSFGISIADDKRSIYLCYTCSHDPKPLEHLISAIWQTTDEYPEAAAVVFRDNELHDAVLDRSEEQIKDKWERTVLEAVGDMPQDVVDFFPLLAPATDDVALEIKLYLTETRRVSLQAIEHFGVRYFAQDRLMIFPMADHSGKIQVLRARPLIEASSREFIITPKFMEREWLTFPKIRHTGVWFGLDKIRWGRAVLIVEGPIDAMCAYTYGWRNVIALCTSKVAAKQVEMLLGYLYYLGFDADEAGKEVTERFRRMLGRELTVVYQVSWDLVTGVDGEGRIHLCKDPGDIENERDFQSVMSRAKFMS
jgi:hypothetical protein